MKHIIFKWLIPSTIREGMYVMPNSIQIVKDGDRVYVKEYNRINTELEVKQGFMDQFLDHLQKNDIEVTDHSITYKEMTKTEKRWLMQYNIYRSEPIQPFKHVYIECDIIPDQDMLDKFERLTSKKI